MKTHPSILLAVVALVTLTSFAHAQTLLQVDLNGGIPPGPTQSGFTAQTVDPSVLFNFTYSGLDTNYISSGSVGLSVFRTGFPGGTWDSGRDRGAVTGSGSFTYSDLYRDFILNNTDNMGSGIDQNTMVFSNLNANTAYQFTFYAYDRSNSNTNAWTQTFASGAVSGVVTWGTGAPSSNSQYAITLTATTNGSGNITWTQTSGGGANPLLAFNGFEIAAIPEPSTIGILAGGLAVLSFFRRRRRTA